MAAALATAMIAAVCCTQTAAPALSGLRGTVVRGPTLPVCRAGTACSAPAMRVVLVFRRNGREARTRTDAKGRYRVALVPGVWSVGLTSTGVGSGLTPRRVRVVAGRVRVVDLSIDTGIR